MAEEVSIKISTDASQAVQSVGSLKKQLREAQQEVQVMADKFGVTSAQAVEAAKKAAELKDRIGDAKDLTDAFNPDRKFQAFSSALQGVVGGISAVQGAMGLLGVENENVQQTLLKVQSAMALSQGINSVLAARDSFKNLGTFIQATTIYQKANNAATLIAVAVQRAFGVAVVGTSTAFKLLKAAIVSTGIGALVVLMGIIIEKMMSWGDSTEDNEAAQRKLNRALEEQEILFAKQQRSLQQQRQIAILRAKIAGQGAEEIYKINQEYNGKDLKAATENRDKILGELTKFQKEKLKKTKSGNLQGTKEDIAAYNEAAKRLDAANEEINKINFQSQIDGLTEQQRIADDGRAKAKEANNKRLNDAKQNANKLKQQREEEAKERLQAEKEANEKIRELENENFLSSIKDETQRALVKLSQDKEKELLSIQQSKANAATKAKEIALIEEKFRIEKDQIELEVTNKRKEQEKKDAEEAANKLRERIDLENQIRIAGITNEFERKKAELQSQKEKEESDLAKQRADNYFSEEVYQQGLLNIKNKYIKAETDLIKQQAEDEKKIQDARKTAQREVYDTIAQGFGALSGLFGQGTAASKAFALGEIAISSATGFARGLDIAQQSAKGTGPAAAFAFPLFYAQQALAVVNIISKARGILKTVKGGSGGTNPSATPPNVGNAPISPQSPQAMMTQLDQGTINRLGSATNRAYVVETDITNSQERIRRINRAARLN